MSVLRVHAHAGAGGWPRELARDRRPCVCGRPRRGWSARRPTKAAADYRAKHYAAARRRLETALKACGDDACASDTRRRLCCAISASCSFGRTTRPRRQKSFDDAVALDATASLNSRYDRPDVHAAWDAAKQRAADAANAAHASETTEAATPSPAAPPETTPPPPVQDEGAAEPPPEAAHYEHLWLGVAGAFDMVVLPSGTDLCKLTPNGSAANSFNAYCTNPDGSDFPSHANTGQNDALVPGQSGTVKGGLQIGDIRAMVAIDYAVSPAWLVGARAGYVMNTYPGTVAVQTGRAYGHPIHVEARVTHLFGQDPLAHVGFAPMVFVAGGVSEFDGHLATSVKLEWHRGHSARRHLGHRRSVVSHAGRRRAVRVLAPRRVQRRRAGQWRVRRQRSPADGGTRSELSVRVLIAGRPMVAGLSEAGRCAAREYNGWPCASSSQGATGVLGRELLPMLADHAVVGMTRSRVDVVRALGAEPVVADVYDRERVLAVVAAARPDVVVHLLTDLAERDFLKRTRGFAVVGRATW